MIGLIVVMGRNNKTGWKNLALQAEELFVCTGAEATGSLLLARGACQMGKIPSFNFLFLLLWEVFSLCSKCFWYSHIG